MKLSCRMQKVSLPPGPCLAFDRRVGAHAVQSRPKTGASKGGVILRAGGNTATSLPTTATSKGEAPVVVPSRGPWSTRMTTSLLPHSRVSSATKLITPNI